MARTKRISEAGFARLRCTIDRPRDSVPEPTSTTRQVALPVALTIVLVVLVALGSRGVADASATGARSGSLTVLLLEVLGSVALVAALVGVWLFWAMRSESRREKKPDAARVHWAIKLLVLALAAALMVGIIAAVLALGGGAGELPAFGIAPAGGAPIPADASTNETPQVPPFPWVLAAVVAVAAIGGVIWWWFTRSTQTVRDAETPEFFERALDDGLAALERESDPRRAVILAYVAMERSLARAGLPRRTAEVPVEYMLRVLHQVPDCAEPANQLTDLFEEARFSHHVISARARDLAVNALGLIRAALARPAT
jgi:hypothetical protein